MSSFAALGVTLPVVEALASAGFSEPFAIQESVIPDGLAGRDILAESPTGSGKTLAFGIPLVERIRPTGSRPQALVVVPTRELATQVTSDLKPLARARGLKVSAVYGGTNVMSQARAAAGAHVLVATPGRLDDLIGQRLVSLAEVRILVLDEADRMLDMGFKPQVDRILRQVPRERQTLLFSATFEGAVADLARTYADDPVHVRLERAVGSIGARIDHAFVPVTATDKLERLVEQLEGERGLALVFVRTKHGADRLARKLERQHGIAATAMHGNLTQGQRERALARFESGRVTTLVATDVAARGLDVDAITHVVNFDPPHADDDYVHRMGRTGRAGRSGTGITLVLPEQRQDVSRLAARLGHGAAFAASGMEVARPAHRSGTPRPGAGRPSRRRRGRGYASPRAELAAG